MTYKFAAFENPDTILDWCRPYMGKDETPDTTEYKYLDYMLDNPEENLGWCKPYTDKMQTSYLIMCDGKPNGITTPTFEANQWDDDFDAALKKLARMVNPDYDLYSGYTDDEIALDEMHETGCSNCPFLHECDCMDEVMEEYENL